MGKNFLRIRQVGGHRNFFTPSNPVKIMESAKEMSTKEYSNTYRSLTLSRGVVTKKLFKSLGLLMSAVLAVGIFTAAPAAATDDYVPMVSAPEIDDVSPKVGPIVGNTMIAISGENYLDGLTVTIGGKPCTGVELATYAPYITCVTPAGVLGAADVVVTNPDTGTVTSVGGFTYVEPTITRLTPAIGPDTGGTTIAMVGTLFNSGVTVKVGGKACTDLIRYGATSLTCVTPKGTVGDKDVVVLNTDLSSATSVKAFKYFKTGSGGSGGSNSGGSNSGGSSIGGNVLVRINGYVQRSAQTSNDISLSTARAQSVKKFIKTVLSSGRYSVHGRGVGGSSRLDRKATLVVSLVGKSHMVKSITVHFGSGSSKLTALWKSRIIRMITAAPKK